MDRDDRHVRLGTLGGLGSSAYAVNTDGSIIGGSSGISDGQTHAFLWSASTGMIDLHNAVVQAGIDLGGYTLQGLVGISSDGTTCLGVANQGSSFRLFLVTGISLRCPADFNADGVVNPDDLSDFITCFFLDAQFPDACPASDFNVDGFRNPDDLSDFITAFFLTIQFGC